MSSHSRNSYTNFRHPCAGLLPAIVAVREKCHQRQYEDFFNLGSYLGGAATMAGPERSMDGCIVVAIRTAVREKLLILLQSHKINLNTLTQKNLLKRRLKILGLHLRNYANPESQKESCKETDESHPSPTKNTPKNPF